MFILFVFNDTATTEIYTLSLHDALPIFVLEPRVVRREADVGEGGRRPLDEAVGEVGLEGRDGVRTDRSEEHTSELQSRQYLVCCLLLETKKLPNANLFYCLLSSLSRRNV